MIGNIGVTDHVLTVGGVASCTRHDKTTSAESGKFGGHYQYSSRRRKVGVTALNYLWTSNVWRVVSKMSVHEDQCCQN